MKLLRKVSAISPIFLPFLPGRKGFLSFIPCFSLISAIGRGEIPFCRVENQPCSNYIFDGVVSWLVTYISCSYLIDQIRYQKSADHQLRRENSSLQTIISNNCYYVGEIDGIKTVLTWPEVALKVRFGARWVIIIS